MANLCPSPASWYLILLLQKAGPGPQRGNYRGPGCALQSITHQQPAGPAPEVLVPNGRPDSHSGQRARPGAPKPGDREGGQPAGSGAPANAGWPPRAPLCINPGVTCRPPCFLCVPGWGEVRRGRTRRTTGKCLPPPNPTVLSHLPGRFLGLHEMLPQDQDCGGEKRVESIPPFHLHRTLRGPGASLDREAGSRFLTCPQHTLTPSSGFRSPPVLPRAPCRHRPAPRIRMVHAQRKTAIRAEPHWPFSAEAPLCSLCLAQSFEQRDKASSGTVTPGNTGTAGISGPRPGGRLRALRWPGPAGLSSWAVGPLRQAQQPLSSSVFSPGFGVRQPCIRHLSSSSSPRAHLAEEKMQGQPKGHRQGRALC